MNKEEIEAELVDDSSDVREAIMRGLLAAYDGSWDEIEGEFSGHIYAIIYAVRAAVAPLMRGQ